LALTLLTFSAGFLDGSPARAASQMNSAVVNAVGDAGRPHWDIPRDANRHPLDVLTFSQVKVGDIVVDLVPADGYYTRILAKLVGKKGKVYALVPMKAAGEARKPGTHDAINAVIALQNTTDYANVTAMWTALNQYGGQFPFPEQLDAVFSADAYHMLYDKT